MYSNFFASYYIFFAEVMQVFLLDPLSVDIYQDSSQVLFKVCPGLKDMPCDRPVHMGQSEEPHCPLHMSLPPPMYRPEEAPQTQSPLRPTPSELYLSTAELQPTENLPLEFSDVCAHNFILLTRAVRIGFIMINLIK